MSRKLADKRGLGLHPLVCAIDECHELFQHPKLGKRAAELAVRLVKRGRKYGIVLLFATQSPTKDSIPREITRNVSCGVAFSVADQIANDGLLGSGKYRAGIRATDLRMRTDRGTCVAVGLTDATFELIRTFYIPFEDGIDELSPVIARALSIIADTGREIASSARLEIEAPPVDHLADLGEVMRGERRIRTQVVLVRLAEHNPDEYEDWNFADLTAALADDGIEPRKSHGVMVVRADDIAAALARRADQEQENADWRQRGEHGGEPAGNRGDLPTPSPGQTPRTEQREPHSGRHPSATPPDAENSSNPGAATQAGDCLPTAEENTDGGADDG